MVWTLENLPERLAAIRSVAERFTQATGVTVEMVGVDENQFTELITASAASGVLPDVVGSLPLAAVRSLAANELLDPAATGQALAALRFLAEQERLVSRTVAVAGRSAEIARAQLQAGTIDIVTALNVQNTLFAQLDLMIQVRLARFQALVDLYRALGGGWTRPDPRSSS